MEAVKSEKIKTIFSKKILIFLGVAFIFIFGLLVFGQAIIKNVKDKALSLYISQLLSKKTGGKVKVEDGGNKVSYSGKEGDFSFQEGTTMPDSFPQDFPLYPDSKVASSWSSKAEGGLGISVALDSSDSIEKIAEFYQKELPSKGWLITSNFDQEMSKTFSFEKGEQKGLVGITEEDGKAVISITINLR